MAQPGDERPDWPPLAIDIPDDARELEADIAAYHREQRTLRRHAKFDRWLFIGRWRRYGLAGPVGVGALVMVAAVASLLALLVPSAPLSAPMLPLDRFPSAEPGAVGGLLPDVVLTTVDDSAKTQQARSLRPAVLALIPRRCNCSDVVASLAGQAESSGVQLVLVTANPADRPTLRTLASQPGHGAVGALYDESGALVGAYAPAGAVGSAPTVVLVHADGVVGSVHTDVDTTTHLPSLTSLARPGHGTS